MSDSDNVAENIFAAVVGVFVGFLAAALISSSKKTSTCPVCNNEIENGIETCPHCHVGLKW